MRTFLSKITSLTAIAAGAALALVVVGAIAIVGGNYAHSQVKTQLVSQQIFFPKPAEWPALKAYAGQQVLTGSQAKLYADDQLQPDMNKIAGGKTYSQVSDAWIAGGMKSATLAAQRQELFLGTTLKSLLLNASAWAQVGSYAITGGIVMVVVGALLFLLPVLNWLLNVRPEAEESKSRAIRPTPVATS
jgi:hypothetical protein